MIAKVKTTAALILRSTSLQPALGIVLGSGYNAVQGVIDAPQTLPYASLPGFKASRVDGHSGQVSIGSIGGTPVVVLCGRCHYYEGHSLAEVTFPIRVLAECGVGAVLLTNAAGGINPKYQPGDFMALTDHLNFMDVNPLRGWSNPKQTPFVDLSQTYDPGLNHLLRKAARQEGVRLHFGVYVAVSGPTYETPAEIRAFARLGGDAVGMSTVPEAVVAKHCGLRVAALSCITNAAAGRSASPITHAEVLAMGEKVSRQSSSIVRTFVQLLGAPPPRDGAPPSQQRGEPRVR